MTDFIASYFGIGPDQLARAAVDTLYMVGWSLVLGTIVAIPLALALVLWRPGGIKSNPLAHGFINAMVNIVRSLRFSHQAPRM